LHGLELRSPLLDHRFFRRVLGLPQEERFTAPPKGIMRGWLGVQKDDRRKMGFNPPLKEWFATQRWKREIGEIPSALSAVTSSQVDPKALSKLVDGYVRGEIGEETIWQLIVLRRSVENLVRR
jgi:asparagine synthase (glutamine-hydrolysing)